MSRVFELINLVKKMVFMMILLNFEGFLCFFREFVERTKFLMFEVFFNGNRTSGFFYRIEGVLHVHHVRSVKLRTKCIFLLYKFRIDFT